jgi:hypothetical protein
MRKPLTFRTAGIALPLAVVAGALLPMMIPPLALNGVVSSSRIILVVKLGKPDAKDVVEMEILRAIKGKKPGDRLRLELAACEHKAWREHIGKTIAARGDDPVPLLVGKFPDRLGDQAGEVGLLQLDRDWLVLEPGGEGVWEMTQVSAVFQMTWDGGSDMFIKALEHTLAHPEDPIPPEAGCRWRRALDVGRLAGRACALEAVELDAGKHPLLFVAADAGDRLYSWDVKKEALVEITKERGLASRSRAAAWADLDTDGRLDLVSWDGAALQLYQQDARGKFTAPAKLAAVIPGDCLALAALEAGAKAPPALLVSTAGGPVLLTAKKPHEYQVAKLPLPAGRELGRAAACLAADFDADGFCDIVQPFEKGGLVYRGRGGGRFAEPVACPVVARKGHFAACAGDFDMDGLLDVFASETDSFWVWVNRGGLAFKDFFGLSGEICYTCRGKAVSASVCDFNNDGRQDLVVTYPDDMVQPYFNRGYRNLNKALELSWTSAEYAPEFADGQQAGTIADLDGDGAQDMALVLADGRIRAYLCEPPVNREGKRTTSSLRAVLPLSARRCGPVTVTGSNPRRCLGAWSVTAGSPGAWFGGSPGDEVTLKWKLPGGQERKRTVRLGEEPLTVELE